MKHCYLGVDIGATKTDVIFSDISGQVIQKFKTTGINIHNLSTSQAKVNLSQLFAKIKSSPQLKTSWKIKSASFGLASFDSEKDKKVWQKLIQSSFMSLKIQVDQLILVTDAYLSLKTGTNSLPGMCLIVGTGTNCYGIDSDLQEFKAGDWGYLIGDQGSGFWIGQQLLQIAIKELDGRLPASLVSDQVLSHTKTSSLSDLIDWSYQDNPVKSFAGLTKILHNPVLITAPQIQYLLHQAISELLISISAVYQQMNLEESVNLVCTGGIFNISEFKHAFIQEISSTLPHIKPIYPQLKPVTTAIEMASTALDQGILPKSSRVITHI